MLQTASRHSGSCNPEVSIEPSWPRSPDGSGWDGKNLLPMVLRGASPFRKTWDVNVLLKEVESILGAQVVDIPQASAGAHNYGLAMELSDGRQILAQLLHFQLPPSFSEDWLLPRIMFVPAALDFPHTVTPTRDFCIALLQSAVEAVFKNKVICKTPGKDTIDPKLLAAKQSILRFIPSILPAQRHDEENLDYYRFVLQHDDYGIHNMSIWLDEEGRVGITSVYDWETGCIVPLILSEIDFLIFGRYLTVDGNGEPSWRLWDPATKVEPEWPAMFQTHARHYVQALKQRAPVLDSAIREGKDARHLWLALKRWRGDDPLQFFCELGTWAEARMREKEGGWMEYRA
ncbi:hypothetical protein M406DRAFT_263472 [Cryphonectria parasitica EP155]|uniref:Uncharacterized protein n=1 Tax=Cryphonectria parasitica (strain ATCC 38755 / EP155) TaxID=660469 RepID=A0A9P4XWW1_CRYP1|nr:uncharacterized protein M406DRAFT_263472 [Cryphonectria parasitica EP155]KAF3762250.1 hypothetical protein M406DRAFT_263472 [Cryphonectria parasitica EP155]